VQARAPTILINYAKEFFMVRAINIERPTTNAHEKFLPHYLLQLNGVSLK